MRFIICSLFSWALVSHAIINGKNMDTVLGVYDTRQQCIKARNSKHSECYEVDTIIPANSI
ncbi:DUF1482 family protein [Citrobacter portucalensis]|uniref:DUF1482 family protein n=1 Tax=Citrobacter portucalensis TaxID=1639133 RepID=UPI00397C174F